MKRALSLGHTYNTAKGITVSVSYAYLDAKMTTLDI